MPPSQDRVFIETEADRWFDRNKSVLRKAEPRLDRPLNLIELYQLKPRRVLEVGASNGFRLAAIAERYGSHTVALDPSFDALHDGKTRFAGLMCVRAEASALPLSGGFNLIIVNFVLHWIDRVNLLRTIAEIDRVLDDDGHLVIGDFYPSSPTRVRYHHRPDCDMWTYKQDYSAAFVASGLYQVVGLLSGAHSSAEPNPVVDDDERAGAWLLRKGLNAFYRDSRPGALHAAAR